MSRFAEAEAVLLAQITKAIENLSAEEHRLARQRAIYRQAATELRIGRKAPAVAALMHEGLETLVDMRP